MPSADAPRIALVKLSSLGDVVHALPVAATLRAARPRARLVWIVERREAAVLREHPALDEVIVADTRGWRRARTPALHPTEPRVPKGETERRFLRECSA